MVPLVLQVPWPCILPRCKLVVQVSNQSQVRHDSTKSPERDAETHPIVTSQQAHDRHPDAARADASRQPLTSAATKDRNASAAAAGATSAPNASAAAASSHQNPPPIPAETGCEAPDGCIEQNRAGNKRKADSAATAEEAEVAPRTQRPRIGGTVLIGERLHNFNRFLDHPCYFAYATVRECAEGLESKIPGWDFSEVNCNACLRIFLL